jgi:carboxyl-terminal processing protease
MNISPHQKFVLTIGTVSLISLLVGWQLGHNDVNKSGGLFTSFAISKDQPANVQASMTKFWKVWDIVNTKYVEKDKIDQKKLIEGATAGMVNALDDPYSVYLTPTQNKDSKDDLEGKFEGVGMQLGFDKDKNIVVVAPIKDSPAERAGMRAGDKIWMINEKETPGMSLPEAVSTIRGEKGTKVKLKIQHEGNPDLIDVEITRDTIYIKSVEFETVGDNKIGHITINRFGDPTKTEWDEAVNQVLNKKLDKVIVDVRNNPGGYLDTAVYINSDFIDGIVMQQEDYMGNKKKFDNIHTPRLKHVTVIGLINKGSASASEIVAGGLQDSGKAKLVGEQSFGKGTIQEVEDLTEGAGIHITTAKWLLPSGKWIHKIGLKPDYEIKLSEDDITNKKDPQLDKAIELLK